MVDDHGPVVLDDLVKRLGSPRAVKLRHHIAAIRGSSPRMSSPSEPNTKRLAVYAAVYRDRNEPIAGLTEQLVGIRESLATQGAVPSGVFVDIILSPRQAGEAEAATLEAERLAHAAFADDDRAEALTFVVVALIASKRTEDPRDDPNSARSHAIQSIESRELRVPAPGRYRATADGLVADDEPDVAQA